MDSEGTIRLARAFCSARDRNVPVLRREHDTGGGDLPSSTDDVVPRPSATSGDLPELVSCLDYGVRCTGWLCPLFTLPTLPPEELLAEAVQAERDRKKKSVAEGRAILERAVREGIVRKEKNAASGDPADPPRAS